MKTKFYFPTMLALLIQVMVSGQSQDNVSRRINANTIPSEGPGKQFEENTKADRISVLIKEADYLDSVAGALKLAAQQRPATEKSIMLTEMMNWHEQSLLIRVEASELSACIFAERSVQNKITLAELMNGIVRDMDILDFAQTLIIDADHDIKAAAGMRTEAKSQQIPAVKLGIMGNAEEKEMMALGKQQRAIELLNSAGKNPENNLLSFLDKK